MIRLIGLAAPLQCGKDTIADYLVEKHGFIKFSFSDALYPEIATAFDVSTEYLRDPKVKETPDRMLAIRRSTNHEFIYTCRALGYDIAAPRSPREILQFWGTEYRRRQNPNYWIEKAENTLTKHDALLRDNSAAPLYFVNTSVRYPNERQMIDRWGGYVWHLFRPNAPQTARSSFSSEQRLPIMAHDFSVWNTGTKEELYAHVDVALYRAKLLQFKH